MSESFPVWGNLEDEANAFFIFVSDGSTSKQLLESQALKETFHLLSTLSCIAQSGSLSSEEEKRITQSLHDLKDRVQENNLTFKQMPEELSHIVKALMKENGKSKIFVLFSDWDYLLEEYADAISEERTKSLEDLLDSLETILMKNDLPEFILNSTANTLRNMQIQFLENPSAEKILTHLTSHRNDLLRYLEQV